MQFFKQHLNHFHKIKIIFQKIYQFLKHNFNIKNSLKHFLKYLLINLL